MAARPILPELTVFLAGVPVFGSLDESVRLELAGHLEPVHAAAGQVVIRQGDPGDGLYLVVSGRVRVSVTAGGAERVLYDLGRGAVVGEMALLSDRPRAATVRAARDSDLLMLRVSSFTSLLERNPALLAGMMRMLVDRVLAADQLLAADRPQAPRPPARTIAVVPAGRNPEPAARVAAQLAGELARSGSVVPADAGLIARQLGPDAALRGPDDPGRAELTGWLHTIERDHDRVLYGGPAGS